MRMTPEERDLLKQTYKLSEENNEILRSIRRSGRISMALRIGYWAVIILLSVGAYYFIQPYVDVMKQLYKQGSETSQSAASALKDLLQ